MDLQQLRNVQEVARCGSISRAAKNLYMSQPNLSKSIRELEEELGIEIFIRRGKRLLGMTEPGIFAIRAQYSGSNGQAVLAVSQSQKQ